MQLTVTLNTEDSEYYDIEIEDPASVTTVDQVIKAAVEQTDADLDEITSFVIVGTI